MTLPLFAGRSTLNRLHQTAQRNILRNHRHSRRHESSKSPRDEASPSTQPAPSRNTNEPPPPLFQHRFPPQAWAWIDPLLVPLRAYGRMQRRSPLITQLESTLVIYYLGDLSAQSVQTNLFVDESYEPLRGLRAMVIGAISSIPGYKWFIFLGRHFNYSSHLLSLAVKIVINQCVFTPVFNCYFFGMQTLLAGGSFAEARERIVNTVPVSWVNSWKLWPAVTAFSFTFVPWQYRNVFAGVIAIGWQTYLSWLNRREENREVKEKKLEGVDHKEKPVEKKKKRRKKKAEKVAEDS